MRLAPRTVVLAGALWGSVLGVVHGGLNVWTPIGPEGGDIYALAIDRATPTTLYAGTYDGRVFKSTDGGGRWSGANTGLTALEALFKKERLSVEVRALVIDPATPSTLYAASYGGGVFKSTDGGGRWSEANTGLRVPTVRALLIDPATPTTLYAGTDFDGIFKSTDGAGRWSEADTGLTVHYVPCLAIDPARPTTVYAGTGGGGVFKSTDAGGHWSEANTGLTNLNVKALVIDPATPSTLYAGTGAGVFKSIDGGGRWSEASSGLPELSGLRLEFDPPRRVKYTVEVRALVIDPATPSTLYAGFGYDSGGVFKSTDGGGHWSEANPGLPNLGVPALAIDPATPTTLYAGTKAGVFKTIDGGGR